MHQRAQGSTSLLGVQLKHRGQWQRGIVKLLKDASQAQHEATVLSQVAAATPTAAVKLYCCKPVAHMGTALLMQRLGSFPGPNPAQAMMQLIQVCGGVGS